MPKTRQVSVPANERWQAFMEGKLTVQDMDDDELARGQFKARDGTFRGRPPKTIPRDFATQLSRELLKRADSKLRERLILAIETLTQEMINGDRSGDRIRAANILLERVMGKVPERVVVSAGRPEWESAVDELLGIGLENEAIDRARSVLGKEKT